MSSAKVFLVGVPLLVLIMPCVIHCSVSFQQFKRFVDSNCLSLGRIAQDICSNTEPACLPVFELVEYCEEFCGRHTMNTALLYSAIMPGNIPRLNATQCRYCARDPTGLTCMLLTFIRNAAEQLATTTASPFTCGAGGSPGTCLPTGCSPTIAAGTCPMGQTCCFVTVTTTTTTTTTTAPFTCGVNGNPGTCQAIGCSPSFAAATCPAGQACCFVIP